jgi:hypothetical protein
LGCRALLSGLLVSLGTEEFSEDDLIFSKMKFFGLVDSG